ncbi:MAG: Clp protease N-terminal domain-containing protein [Terracoccus sp.]
MASMNRKAVGMAAAGVAAAAAIGLGVTSGAQADTSAPTPTVTSTQGSTGAGTADAKGDGKSGHHRPGGMPGMPGMGKGLGGDAKALASKLGVDETTLKDALKAVRDDLKATRKAGSAGTTNPDPAAMQDEMASALASKLGIDATKVKAALTELRTAQEADRQKAFDDRLATAVTDGTLTQADADSVKKAAKAGVIGMGRGRH